ncbi:MAG: sigma-54-dependent Fis family transcriptional regulator [Proteobacteria bacterium]|nr:sigma-54-dependent Fis family transcriptional regulator [Pseudomonadota bacterium]
MEKKAKGRADVSHDEGSRGLVLLVDDDRNFLLSASSILRKGGIDMVQVMEDGRNVLPFLEKTSSAVVVLDLNMPHVSGRELLSGIKAKYPDVSVIILTGMDDLDTAVECMKGGAFDYLVKPVEEIRFLSSIRKAVQLRQLHEELFTLKERILSDSPVHRQVFSEVITTSSRMENLFRYAEAVAVSDQPVLVTGETGVGKELIAKALHTLSGRQGEFIAVSVAGLDDQMFSDTLFGHEKGAFTGAERMREGLIQKAEGGTLFLDEIGDLPGPSQVKLLRLLQEREYYPLGSDRPKRSSARVLVATNRDLVEEQENGRFRKDLFYRLKFHHIKIPSLRERPEDIPFLLDHFLGQAARSLGRKKPTYPPELVTLLKNYHFPGNIRELEGMVHDAVARHDSGVLSAETFRESIGISETGMTETEWGGMDQGSEFLIDPAKPFPSLKKMEENMILEAMRRAEGNQRIAAEILGVTRQALNKRLVRAKKDLSEG